MTRPVARVRGPISRQLRPCRATLLIGAGAGMLAVISAVFYTEDTFKAASDLSSLFDRNPAVAGQGI